MKNARNQKGRNRNGRDAAVASAAKRQGIGPGGRGRTDASRESGDKGRVDRSEIGTGAGVRLDTQSERNDSGPAIADEQGGGASGIGAGHGGGSDSGGDGGGRRRGRPLGSGTRSRDASGDHADAGQESSVVSQPDIREIDKPLKTRGRPRKSKTAENTQKTMVTLLAVSLNVVFTSVALLTKHDHWSLEREESTELSKVLNDALSTLPEKTYAKVSNVIEKWGVWTNLIFVFAAILLPRIEESNKRAERKRAEGGRAEPNQGGDGGHAPTEDNPFRDTTFVTGNYGNGLT